MEISPLSLPRSETEDIQNDLKAKLVAGELAPGRKLKPADLQGEYGCSANTVRDVLMRLVNLGLVEFQLQRGFWATESTLERRSDVARFRMLLEQEGAAESMKRGGVGWEAKLTGAHHALSHIEHQIQAAGEVTEFIHLWTDAEQDFHETMISACASPLHIQTWRQVYLQFRQQNIGQQRDFGSNAFATILTEHQAIVDAALARDEAACRRAIHQHLARNILPPDGTANEEWIYR
ncbi:MAG: GntR family transcriptional regulator [Pseudomonadota bacterium]